VKKRDAKANYKKGKASTAKKNLFSQAAASIKESEDSDDEEVKEVSRHGKEKLMVEEGLTRSDMQNALYYLRNKEDLRMAHYQDSQEGDLLWF
jgi:uncharacterized membrane protein